jgi:hypothetical protein
MRMESSRKCSTLRRKYFDTFLLRTTSSLSSNPEPAVGLNIPRSLQTERSKVGSLKAFGRRTSLWIRRETQGLKRSLE